MLPPYHFSEESEIFAENYFKDNAYTENYENNVDIEYSFKIIVDYLEAAYFKTNEINALKYIYEIEKIIPEIFFLNGYINTHNKNMYQISDELNKYLIIGYKEYVDLKILCDNYAYKSEWHNFLWSIKKYLIDNDL